MQFYTVRLAAMGLFSTSLTELRLLSIHRDQAVNVGISNAMFFNYSFLIFFSVHGHRTHEKKYDSWRISHENS